MTVSNTQKPAKSFARRVVDIAGSVVGIAAGAYSGANLLLPAIAGGNVFFILSKTRWIKSKSLLAAASIQAGQAIWMAIGLGFILAGALNAPRVDFFITVEIIGYVLLVAILIWLRAKGLVYVLLVYQALCIVVHILNLTGILPAGLPPRAIVAHLLLRVAAILCMVQFLREKPKEDLVSAF